MKAMQSGSGEDWAGMIGFALSFSARALNRRLRYSAEVFRSLRALKITSNDTPMSAVIAAHNDA